ncbi:MAG: BTAD domain-containing putative transcriptional regulator [Actinomycetota bacterium]
MSGSPVIAVIDPAEWPDPDVSVLGTARVHGAPVTAGQRALVAALVLHRHDGASTDTLIDAIWPHGAPNSARASVQNQVARLRRVLGAGSIVYADGRYRLAGTTDVDRMEHAVEQLSQPGGAASTPVIAAALDLWRGVAFEDLPDDHHAQVARVALEQQRSALVERLAAEWLRAGRTADTTTLLRVRTAEAPFHERAWELLITALYECDRRTEALATYMEFETLLAERLGTTPSQRVRALRSTIADERPLSTCAEAPMAHLARQLA